MAAGMRENLMNKEKKMGVESNSIAMETFMKGIIKKESSMEEAVIFIKAVN